MNDKPTHTTPPPPPRPQERPADYVPKRKPNPLRKEPQPKDRQPSDMGNAR
jgi:hypothetical protein